MEHIDERFILALYAVDVDGRDAAGNVATFDGEMDVLHQEGLFGLGDGPQLHSRGASFLVGESDDAHVFQHAFPGTHQVLLLGVPADEDRRRQLLLVQDDDGIIDRSGDREAGGLVGDVEELQRVGRHGDLKSAVHGGDGACLVFGHADLDVFDGFAFFVDNPALDSDALLCMQADGEKQERKQ